MKPQKIGHFYVMVLVRIYIESDICITLNKLESRSCYFAFFMITGSEKLLIAVGFIQVQSKFSGWSARSKIMKMKKCRKLPLKCNFYPFSFLPILGGGSDRFCWGLISGCGGSVLSTPNPPPSTMCMYGRIHTWTVIKF